LSERGRLHRALLVEGATQAPVIEKEHEREKRVTGEWENEGTDKKIGK
jgi:hypothetical protein